MVKTITYKEDNFLKEVGIESLRLYGNSGEFYFSFFTFVDTNYIGRKYTWKKPLVAEDLKGAFKEFKNVCKGW